MSEPAPRLATYAELLALPGEVRAELIGGHIVTLPSPTPKHQSTIGSVYAELRAPFERGRGGPGGWWLIPDVDVQFTAHDVLRPDISGWRRERVPEFPAERPIAACPDWVCEGLSPASAVRDHGDKRVIYQRAGIAWYWIIDPFNRTLNVYRLTADGYVLEVSVGDRGAARLNPFAEVELELDALFPDPPPASS